VRVYVHCQGIDLTDEDREHLDRRLMFGLSQFSSRIRHLMIRICDTNGSRGGIDKRCRLLVRVQGLEEIAVEARQRGFAGCRTRGDSSCCAKAHPNVDVTIVRPNRWRRIRLGGAAPRTPCPREFEPKRAGFLAQESSLGRMATTKDS